jgi:hypothetical protein
VQQLLLLLQQQLLLLLQQQLLLLLLLLLLLSPPHVMHCPTRLLSHGPTDPIKGGNMLFALSFPGLLLGSPVQ